MSYVGLNVEETKIKARNDLEEMFIEYGSMVARTNDVKTKAELLNDEFLKNRVKELEKLCIKMADIINKQKQMIKQLDLL